MRKILLICCSILLGANIYAQNFTEALRYSRMETQGTARFNAMGGSFGALGGEVSGLNKNPGGIGIYRNSEFTLSAGFNVFDSETRYLGEQRSDGRLNFNIPNISYVGSYRGNVNGWKNYSFGLSYNRVSTFNQESRLNGNTANSSKVDDYIKTLNTTGASVSEVEDFQYPYGPSEAWNILMIDTITQNGVLSYVPFVFLQDNVEQSRTIETSGNQSETSFTFGGNYQDRWFVGGGIGFQRIRFDREYSFTENYTYNSNIDRSQYFGTRYNENTSLLTIGTGINFKLGAIYRINDAVRVGGAIHSPTYFGFAEEFIFESSSTFTNGESFDSGESIGEYNYQLRTPARFIGSFAYLFKQRASINFDYEYVDYSNAKLNDGRNTDYDFSPQNRVIENNLSSTHNVRVGAEIIEGPFVFRAGFRYNGNPYAANVPNNPDESRNIYSIGSGFRSRNFNLDVAYSTFKMNVIDQVYNNAPEIARIEEREHNLIFTVGWRW